MDRIGALVRFVFGAVWVWIGIGYSRQSRDGGPRAGVLPTALGVIIMALAALGFARREARQIELPYLPRILLIFASLIAYAALLGPLGYVVSTALLLGALLLAFAERRHWWQPVAAVGVSFTPYALFRLGHPSHCRRPRRTWCADDGHPRAHPEESLHRETFKTDLKGLWPTLQDWMAVRWTLLRATIVGFFVGALPGAGATVASFMAYAAEKKASKHPEWCGTGVIEGVAAPEAANNAATGGALVPLLTLGLPSSATTAILLGALLILNVRPGPLMISERPEFFWAVVTSMYVGNVMLLVLNLPLVGIWASLLRIPYTILLPLILLFTLIGAYALNNNVWDIWVMIAFGVIGHLMRKLDYPAAPVVLALVLGPLIETNFRRALTISQGDYSVFVSHPISAFLLLCAAASLAWPLLVRALTGGRREVAMPVAEEI